MSTHEDVEGARQNERGLKFFVLVFRRTIKIAEIADFFVCGYNLHQSRKKFDGNKVPDIPPTFLS